MNNKKSSKGPSRRHALQMGGIVLLLGTQHIARGASIIAVRVWPSKDYTRLTIESDTAIKARQFFIPEPPRLAVDIEGIDLIPALRELVAKVKSDDPNISGIRVGQNAPQICVSTPPKSPAHRTEVRGAGPHSGSNKTYSTTTCRVSKAAPACRRSTYTPVASGRTSSGSVAPVAGSAATWRSTRWPRAL